MRFDTFSDQDPSKQPPPSALKSEFEEYEQDRAFWPILVELQETEIFKQKSLDFTH